MPPLPSGASAFGALRMCRRTLQELPADSVRGRGLRAVRNALYSHVEPTPVRSPRVLAWSKGAMQLLGLPEQCAASEHFAAVFSGNVLLPETEPYAHAYGGHQFGSWAGQLGDGRAITLCEVEADDGGVLELQLKGAGLTPYSRFADGRAVLRSSLREFVASEHMHALGVPTTRALCLLTTGDQVMRDQFYSGNPQYEPGAIVCRVARSFIRIGTLQLLVAREENDNLATLIDFIIRHHYPELGALQDRRERCLALFRAVVARSARLVAHWQAVGFTHGTLNTDNISMLGDTLDYGPFGFMEHFDPQFVPNTSDPSGRYSFAAQPAVMQWNLARLGSCLLPFVPAPELKEALSSYADEFNSAHLDWCRRKLGLRAWRGDDDEALLTDLMRVMGQHRLDFTNTFHALAFLSKAAPASEPAAAQDSSDACTARLSDLLHSAWPQADTQELTPAALEDLAVWLARYEPRAFDGWASPAEFILRNHVAQRVIERVADGDEQALHRLLDVMTRPFEDHDAGADEYRLPAPRDAWRPGVTLVSCSS